MNKHLQAEALAIKKQIKLAQQRLVERDRILAEMEMVRGRVQRTNRLVRMLDDKAQEAKQYLDAVRGRVLPVVRGWLAGEGSPEEQAAAAEKVYHAAVADVASQQKALAALEQEQEALEMELLEVAVADDELRAALEKRDQYLIAHGGKLGRELAEFLTEIAALKTKQSTYREALELGYDLIQRLKAGDGLLWPRDDEESFLEKLVHTSDLTVAIGNAEDEARKDQEIYTVQTAVTQATQRFQEKLILIGERLWPQPTINWRTLGDFQTAYATKQVFLQSIRMKIERLALLYEVTTAELAALIETQSTIMEQLLEELFPS